MSRGPLDRVGCQEKLDLRPLRHKGLLGLISLRECFVESRAECNSVATFKSVEIEYADWKSYCERVKEIPELRSPSKSGCSQTNGMPREIGSSPFAAQRPRESCLPQRACRWFSDRL